MSVCNVSSSTYQPNQINRPNQCQQDFQNLADALQSGNLSSAQQSFASLLQLVSGSSSQANSQTQTVQQVNTTNPIDTAITNLGQALQSGDLTSAQSDFSELQQDVQSTKAQGHHHHHHHHHMSDGSQSASDATSPPNSTTPIEADLNALGQAIQDGDMKGVGNDYSQLMQDVQAIKQAYNPAFATMQSTNSTAGSNVGFATVA